MCLLQILAAELAVVSDLLKQIIISICPLAPCVWTQNNALNAALVVAFWYLLCLRFWDVNSQSRTCYTLWIKIIMGFVSWWNLPHIQYLILKNKLCKKSYYFYVILISLLVVLGFWFFNEGVLWKHLLLWWGFFPCYVSHITHFWCSFYRSKRFYFELKFKSPLLEHFKIPVNYHYIKKISSQHFEYFLLCFSEFYFNSGTKERWLVLGCYANITQRLWKI